eukprot:4159-Pleurochrysis_carterae.AAC.4
MNASQVRLYIAAVSTLLTTGQGSQQSVPPTYVQACISLRSFTPQGWPVSRLQNSKHCPSGTVALLTEHSDSRVRTRQTP